MLCRRLVPKRIAEVHWFWTIPHHYTQSPIKEEYASEAPWPCRPQLAGTMGAPLWEWQSTMRNRWSEYAGGIQQRTDQLPTYANFELRMLFFWFLFAYCRNLSHTVSETAIPTDGISPPLRTHTHTLSMIMDVSFIRLVAGTFTQPVVEFKMALYYCTCRCIC